MAPSGKEAELEEKGAESPELEQEVVIESVDEADPGEEVADQEVNGEAQDLEPSIEDQLAQALEEVTKFKDDKLRAEAEMQNIRRRAERDVQNAHKFGIERFLTNLLPVVDSLEKAIEIREQEESSEDDPVIVGVKLCHKILLESLERENIEVIDPMGEPFDPNEHEAMSMVENPDMEPNSVFAVVQKGYKLNSRLVRPAMVMVTKAAK
ncbi:MAG: nucleotide exchange factor GrpE [Pseudomonadales bacterium]